MSHHNEMEVRFLSLPENEAFARVVIAAFAVQLSPNRQRNCRHQDRRLRSCHERHRPRLRGHARHGYPARKH